MTQPHSDPPPLAGDPARQVPQVLRGYRYQIWRSVEAWLDLGDDEALALEGAEDIDILGHFDATAIQVKDLARNVTLRSSEVLEAIGNFWNLRQMNPGRPLRFRFLTTAEAGFENGAPFGAGKAGFDAWRRAAKTGEGIDSLRCFLGDQRLPESLGIFMREASDEQIRTQLLEPVEWALGQGPAEYVEEAVRERLIVLGHPKGVLATDAERVAATLFTTTFDVASRKDRRILCRAELLKIFDRETAKIISPAQAFAAASAFDLLPGIQSGITISSGAHHPISGPPPLPARLASRGALVANLATALAGMARLVLTGSTGTGKSTLANLLVGRDWLWARFDTDLAINRTILRDLAHQLETKRSQAGVVFDDYTPALVDEVAFGGLAYRLQDHGTPFVVTTSRSVLSKILVDLDIPGAAIFPIPGLLAEEIEELLVVYGCPSDQLTVLSPLLLNLTSGHPQLVHARIRDLAAANWQTGGLQQVLQITRSAEEVQKEARAILQRLPEPTRTLAYRLSLIGQPFRRDHALSAAAISPPVNFPGEAFDRLNGPWLERLDDRYFRVSPLLSGAANAEWPPLAIEALHRSLAEILVRSAPLTQIEAVGGFFHAFSGRDAGLVLRLAVALLRANRDSQKLAFTSLQWLAYVGVEQKMPAFLSGSKSLLVRMLQYRLADEAKQKLKIAERWDHESHTAAAAEDSPMYRLQFTATLLMDYQTGYPVKRLLEWLREAAEIDRELKRVDPAFALGPVAHHADRPAGFEDIATGLFMFVLAHCTGREDLLQLLEGLATMDDAFRVRLLRLFDLVPGAATHLVDSAWLKEADSEWRDTIAVLQQAEKSAELWGREDLRQASVRAQSAVIHEHDPDQALGILRSRRGSSHSGLLENQEASLLHERGDHAAAWQIWRDGLGRWDAEGDLDEITLAYAFREAAITTAKLGEWADSAHLFLEASTRLEKNRRRSGTSESSGAIALVPQALIADHAYSLWRAGHWPESIVAFESVLVVLEHSGSRLGGFDEYRGFTKLLSHVLLWLYEPVGLAEPSPGVFSVARDFTEILSLPPSSVQHLWALLAQLESTFETDDRIVDRLRRAVSVTSNRELRFLLYNAEIARDFQGGTVYDIVPMLAAFCLVATKEGSLAGCILQELFFALLSLLHHEPDVYPPWARWKTDLHTAVPDNGETIDPWLDAAKNVIGLDIEQVRSELTRPPVSTLRVALLAVRVATQQGFAPAQIFQAQFILTTLFPRLDRRSGDLVSSVVATGWRRLVANPATLLSPRVTIPPILLACGSETTGIRKAAAVLLAAEPAVALRFDSPTRKLLKALRDGDSSTTGGATDSTSPKDG
jgi:hypothetical protein